MTQPLRVLLVEDDPNDAELLLRELRRAGFDPGWCRVDTEEAYIASLNPDLQSTWVYRHRAAACELGAFADLDSALRSLLAH